MSLTEKIKIGNRSIGEDEPLYLIAEVGTTCLGDIEQAYQLIDAGADAGMDSVKFQLIDADQESDKTATYDLQTPQGKKSVNRSEMFSALQFSLDEWEKISEKCKQREVEFFATVDYIKGVELLESLNVPIHKIGAWDTTFEPLISAIGATGKPMMVDLGPTTKSEIDDINKWYLDAGGTAVIYLHDYHTQDDEEMNMAAIKYLQTSQQWPVGYSSPAHDHDIDFLSIGQGAKVLEKRLIIDRNINAFHAHESLEPNELADWVKRIRHVERSIGKQDIIPSTVDVEGKVKYYRSICTTRPVKAGDLFSPDNLHGKRPGTGLPTKLLHEFWGKKASRDLDVNTLITEDDTS